MTRRRAGAAIVLACAAVLLLASPASAHSGGAAKATNDRAEIVAVRPTVPGLRVRLIDAGTRIELDAGDHRVFVFGYEGEDYLRIDERGVFENVRSPALYLNQSINGNAPPAFADPTASASWQKVSDGTVARWHDHSLHAARGAPARGGVVTSWERELLVDDHPVKIVGRVVRLPSRSRVPWLLGAGAIALVVIVLSRFAWGRVTVVALGVLVAADAARVVGLVAESPAWLRSRWRVAIDVSTLSIIGWGMAVCAIVLLAKRRRFEAATAAAVSAAVLAVSGGILEVRDLSGAVLGSALDDGLARGVVAVVLGAALGVCLASGLELRRAMSRPAPRRPRSGTAPSPGDGTRTASPSAPPSG